MLDVPHLRQAKAFTCGPACVNMLLRYHGIVETELAIAEALGTTPREGTNPRTLASYLRAQGFVAHSKSRRNLADIKADINKGRPVIVAYQAHGPRGTDYATCWDQGHYGIVVDVDSKRVTLCDPSSKRSRRHYDISDFVARWRDISAGGVVFLQWGLSVGPKR